MTIEKTSGNDELVWVQCLLFDVERIGLETNCRGLAFN